MFERTHTDDPMAPQPPERVMRISPMDMRQQRFRSAFRGYDRTDVVAFLTEAADDYEHAMREIDRMRGDLMRMEALLTEHRQREEVVACGIRLPGLGERGAQCRQQFRGPLRDGDVRGVAAQPQVRLLLSPRST